MIEFSLFSHNQLTVVASESFYLNGHLFLSGLPQATMLL
uniref:Uncharacterized protein n=1 Tax=Methylophaga nitratireducenticrescens TaxID=754476 RepID=I1XGC2_METNJ